MKDREKAIAMLRNHCHVSARAGNVLGAYRDLKTAADALVQEFRVEFDVPGTRYWENWRTRQHLSTMPGEQLQHPVEDWVELNRIEFISRQGIIVYDEDSL